MLSFKPAFSLSSFTLNKGLFSSSSLSAIRVVSSVYLRLLIVLPAILIQAYNGNGYVISPIWRFVVGETDEQRQMYRDVLIAVNALTGEIIIETRGLKM